MDSGDLRKEIDTNMSRLPLVGPRPNAHPSPPQTCYWGDITVIVHSLLALLKCIIKSERTIFKGMQLAC